jgi:uncharacterized protein YndB with AHSA1/START domain
MSDTDELDLVLERFFDAPRDRVYRAFTDPVEMAAWFGPVGYSVPLESIDMDVRAGGHQRFTMGPDDDPAAGSAVNATFVEVIENELIVGEEVVEGIPGFPDGLVMHIRFEFYEATAGRTRLVITQGPYTRDFEGMARAGWESSFTKLDALLSR